MSELFTQEDAMERYGYECREEGRYEATVTCIHNLMDTMNFTMEKAMDVLDVPLEDRERYAAAIKALDA